MSERGASKGTSTEYGSSKGSSNDGVLLRGRNDQNLLISAVRYAMGRETYMPQLTCDVLREQMEGIEPYTAAIIARDIRNWWTSYYADGQERTSFYRCDVQPFVDLLPLLDERTLLEYKGRYYEPPYLPVGYDYWKDVPEEVRLRETGRVRASNSWTMPNEAWSGMPNSVRKVVDE